MCFDARARARKVDAVGQVKRDERPEYEEEHEADGEYCSDGVHWCFLSLRQRRTRLIENKKRTSPMLARGSLPVGVLMLRDALLATQGRQRGLLH